MKDYPSIPRAAGHSFREIPQAYIFDKLDGSCMRSEWAPKRGWFKHGRRNGLLDDSNPALTVVPALFEKTLAEPLERLARNNKWQHAIVFYEFWGPNSIAGLHDPNDEKMLTVFDAAVNKKGILGPAEFRQAFEDKVDTAKLIERTNWTRGYVELIKAGQVEGITFEGVVAKSGSGHNILRSKAKTQAWIDKVIAIHGELAGIKLIES